MECSQRGGEVNGTGWVWIEYNQKYPVGNPTFLLQKEKWNFSVYPVKMHRIAIDR